MLRNPARHDFEIAQHGQILTQIDVIIFNGHFVKILTDTEHFSFGGVNVEHAREKGMLSRLTQQSQIRQFVCNGLVRDSDIIDMLLARYFLERPKLNTHMYTHNYEAQDANTYSLLSQGK
jgi:hypothetical protein